MKSLVESRWKFDDYECAILCIPYGHRCGYVGIPNTHHLYRVFYIHILDDLDVHGGITYSGFGDFKYPIFQNVKNAKWFFGFDTAHYMDAKDPEILKMFDMPRQANYSILSTVKTNEYCVNETNKLAEQLKIIERSCPR